LAFLCGSLNGLFADNCAPVALIISLPVAADRKSSRALSAGCARTVSPQAWLARQLLRGGQDLGNGLDLGYSRPNRCSIEGKERPLLFWLANLL
jgi:hypothetical protein